MNDNKCYIEVKVFVYFVFQKDTTSNYTLCVCIQVTASTVSIFIFLKFVMHNNNSSCDNCTVSIR